MLMNRVALWDNYSTNAGEEQAGKTSTLKKCKLHKNDRLLSSEAKQTGTEKKKLYKNERKTTTIKQKLQQ